MYFYKMRIGIKTFCRRQQIFTMMSSCVTEQTGGKCTASVILMHGSGGTGEDLRETFQLLLGEELQFPHIRFIYPTAPCRPYSLANGMHVNVWFDRQNLGLEGTELTKSVDAMAAELGRLIDDEVKSGIPAHRILIGGFSMGGCMALHLGYKFYPQVAGVLAMSSFLSDDSSVYKHLEARDPSSPIPPLQQYHGEEDNLVLYDWGKATHENLRQRGVKAEFFSLPKLFHVMNPYMAKSAREWIAKMLPEDQSFQ